MKFLKRIFKRFRKPKYAPCGYVTPTAAWDKHPRSGEMIISREQSVFINENVAKFGENGENVEETIKMITEAINGKIKASGQIGGQIGGQMLKQEYKTNCPNCGAPLKDGKCEYCGTTYNN